MAKNKRMFIGDLPIDFIFTLLHHKLKDITIGQALSALNYLGYIDQIIYIKKLPFNPPPDPHNPWWIIELNKRTYLWELSVIEGLARDIHCRFCGGPSNIPYWYNGTLVSVVIDRMLFAAMVENRDIIKSTLKMLTKKGFCEESLDNHKIGC